MGYFYNKFLESAVTPPPQTDDSVGNDLNGIENAIAGSDGIEAHRDEVEDAVEGLIGDPVDECMVIIAEGEYNWNKFMKQIGIQELYEVATGDSKDEKNESKIKRLATNFVRWLRQIWEKIKALFEKIKTKLKINNKKAKDFINGTTMLNSGDNKEENNSTKMLNSGDRLRLNAGLSNREIIEKGFYDGEWEIDSPNLYYIYSRNEIGNIRSVDDEAIAYITKKYIGDRDKINRKIIYSITKLKNKPNNISDMIKELDNDYLNLIKYKNGTNLSKPILSSCYKILSDKTIKYFDDIYKWSKESYDKFIDDPSYFEDGWSDHFNIPIEEDFTSLKFAFDVNNAFMN